MKVTRLNRRLAIQSTVCDRQFSTFPLFPTIREKRSGDNLLVFTSHMKKLLLPLMFEI